MWREFAPPYRSESRTVSNDAYCGQRGTIAIEILIEGNEDRAESICKKNCRGMYSLLYTVLFSKNMTTAVLLVLCRCMCG